MNCNEIETNFTDLKKHRPTTQK